MSTASEVEQLRPCPVCTRPEGLVEQVDPARVWAALESEFAVTISEELRARHASSGTWCLVTCAACGLQHFANAPQGDAEFYAVLSASPRYYEADRWEFGVVRDLVTAGQRVLDIGCGTGAFLRSLPSTTSRVGLDHNGPALVALKEADPTITARVQDALDHAAEVGASYDVVTAFQVLEHVEDPTALLASAAALLAPTGALYVSVPHRDRAGRAGFEPLDHPPHHLTRWRLPQLTTAAERVGLSVDDAWFEPPDESIRMTTLTQLIERRSRALPSRLGHQVVRAGRRALDSSPARRSLTTDDWYLKRGASGHTLLVRMRPPAAASATA